VQVSYDHGSNSINLNYTPSLEVSMPCQGYQIPSCWITPAKNSIFCATCLHRKYEDILQTVAVSKNSDILHILQSIQGYILQSDAIDRLLKLLYTHHRNLLREYLETPEIQGTLCTRIRYHSETDICPVYSWMIRNDKNTDILPRKCIRCITSSLLYSPTPELIRMIRFINIPIEQNDPLQVTLRKALSNKQTLKEFVDAVIYSIPEHLEEVMKFIDRYDPTNSVKDDCKNHPVNIAKRLSDTATKKFETYTFLTSITEKFKEELLTIAWSPDRVLDWCIDIEEVYIIRDSYC